MWTIAKASFRSAAPVALLRASAATPAASAASPAGSIRRTATAALAPATLHPRNCACPAHATTHSAAAHAAPTAAVTATTVSSFSLEQSPTAASVFSLNGLMVPHYGPADLVLILPEHAEVDEIECAVPKKRHSVSRSRSRRAGDRLQKRRRVYSNYRVCFVCGTPVIQHHICTKCMHIPTRA